MTLGGEALVYCRYQRAVYTELEAARPLMLTSRSHIPALNVIIGEIDILAPSWSDESAKGKSC